MQIFINNNLEGHSFILEAAEATDTIENVKYMIQDIEGIPIMPQSLIFGSEPLEDKRALASYNIQMFGPSYLLKIPMLSLVILPERVREP